MKVAFVMPQLFGGGAERVVAALSSAMCRKDGFEIHLITYECAGEHDYPVDGAVYRHSMDSINGDMLSRVFHKILFLRNILSEIKPDCVVSLGGVAIISLLTVAMTGSRVPLILSERNDPKRYPTAKVHRLLRNLAYRLCDAVVFQTHEAKNYFSRNIQRKGTVIPNPLTSDLPERYTGIREPKIVTCCRLSPQKNLDLMFDAFSDIADRFPKYSLHVYGEGDERARLKAKIQEMNLKDRIILEGYSKNIYEKILKASLFVLSSDYEGISNAMLEAIAMGIPSVCTDCPAGGARETIEDGVNGLLVPVGGRREMAEAMERLITDTSFADALGTAGSSLRDKISVDTVSQQWVDLIVKITGNKQ